MKLVIRVGFFLLCFCIPALSSPAQSEIVTIRTVAGNGKGINGDGPATSVRVDPTSVAVDAAGNVFIIDGNYDVRKVTAGGLITTFGLLGDWSPNILAVDAAGVLYITDDYNHVVYKVTSGSEWRIFAGIDQGKIGFSGDGGPVTSSLLNSPRGIAVDTAGSVFIADSGNHRVRKITPDGVIRTIAGNGGFGISGDGGPATSAQIGVPAGVVVDAAGNIFISDSLNHRVRMVTPDGLIRTIAGNGGFGFSGDGGPATSAQLNGPTDVAVDAAGNLFIMDSLNYRIRKVTPDGVIRTAAGNGTRGFDGDGGPATSAQIGYPAGIAVDAAGNLFIADTENHRIRKVGRSAAGTSKPGGSNRDFNGDGATDVLFRDTVGNVSMWLMNGYNIVSDSFIANIWTGWTIVGSGDFDGDGKADILWRDIAGNVAIWLMDGATITSYGSTGNMPMAWATTAVADFDGDGKSDVLWRDTAGNVLVWLMNGSRIANYSLIAKIWTGWTITGTGDFNGDGKADILWRDTSGNVAIWLMDGETVSRYSSTGFIPTEWTVAGVADFDGDGRADVLWRNASGDVASWLMNGTNISNNSFIANIWTGWSIAGTGDFNGDGKADILWRDSSGNVAIWLMDGTAIASFSSMGNVSDRMVQ